MLFLDCNTIIHLKLGKRLLPASNSKKMREQSVNLFFATLLQTAHRMIFWYWGKPPSLFLTVEQKRAIEATRSQARPCTTKAGRLCKTGVKLIEAQNRTGFLSTVQGKKRSFAKGYPGKNLLDYSSHESISHTCWSKS